MRTIRTWRPQRSEYWYHHPWTHQLCHIAANNPAEAYCKLLQTYPQGFGCTLELTGPDGHKHWFGKDALQTSFEWHRRYPGSF